MQSSPFAMTAEQAPLLARLNRTRAQTDRLFELVHPESLYERPIAERHRIVFYIGHLEAFDWNLLRDRMFRLDALHPEYDRLFAFGIDPVGGGLPSDQPQDWPALGDVREYVNRVRGTLDDGLQSQLSGPSGSERPEFPFPLLLQVAI